MLFKKKLNTQYVYKENKFNIILGGHELPKEKITDQGYAIANANVVVEVVAVEVEYSFGGHEL